MENSKKARGLYKKMDDANKALYDEIMQKTIISDLEKFTKKELAYLTDLYERKVKEVKASNKELDEKDVLTIAMSIKLKATVLKKHMNLGKYRYAKANQLTNEQKIAARTKLNRICKI